MTYYVAGYDAENFDKDGPFQAPTCLEACRKIVEKHLKYRIPATFFVVGEALEANPKEYRELLDNPLFEIASHTYSHKTLLDHPVCGPGCTEEEIWEEIERGKKVVEDIFQRPCKGLRTPCGYVEHLQAEPLVLKILSETGHEYLSSVGWGMLFTQPAPLMQSFTYGRVGFPNIREFPAHGWQDLLLRGHVKLCNLAFPLPFPDAVPNDYVKTPEEEFATNGKYFIDRALEENLTYVNFVFHPWSMGLFDSEMRILDITFEYVAERNMQTITFSGLNDLLNESSSK